MPMAAVASRRPRVAWAVRRAAGRTMAALLGVVAGSLGASGLAPDNRGSGSESVLLCGRESGLTVRQPPSAGPSAPRRATVDCRRVGDPQPARTDVVGPFDLERPAIEGSCSVRRPGG